jgi:cold shock CspA family protein
MEVYLKTRVFAMPKRISKIAVPNDSACYKVDGPSLRLAGPSINSGVNYMKLPLQITFRNMDPSEAVEAKVRGEAEKLDTLYDQIMRCSVVVEAHHKRHHKGNIYHVRIDLTVPGGELVADREPGRHHAHEDVYVAIRDAFNAAGRQLKDYVGRRRRDVKTHEAPPHGKISELFTEEGYGKIESSDGREIYFHKNSVLNADFDKLEVGAEVRFAEEEGDRGPQASTVKVVGKHHVVD